MNYKDMIRTFAGATGLTRTQAEDAALVDALAVLAEALSPDETRDLLAQLPKSLRERVPVSSETLTMRPIEFVARVADLGGVSNEDAERNIRAAYALLTEAVNAGEMNDIAEQLGDGFADLLGRSERLARTRAANGSDGILGVVAGAVNSVVPRRRDAVAGPGGGRATRHRRPAAESRQLTTQKRPERARRFFGRSMFQVAALASRRACTMATFELTGFGESGRDLLESNIESLRGVTEDVECRRPRHVDAP